MRPASSVFVALVIGCLIVPTTASADEPQEPLVHFAHWKPDGYGYPAIIQKRENDRLLVRYTDGTTEWLPEWDIGEIQIGAGDVVYGDWLNKGQYYRGRVAQRDGNKIRIHYDDGDVEDTNIAFVRLKVCYPEAKKIGCAVFARWDPDGYWYSGVIKEIRDGKFRIDYDDGDTAWVEAKQLIAYSPTFGDEVQANWENRGPFYNGCIISRNGQQVRVKYDDGSVEDTTMAKLRTNYDRACPATVARQGHVGLGAKIAAAESKHKEAEELLKVISKPVTPLPKAPASMAKLLGE